jgi:hypothetical protein
VEIDPHNPDHIFAGLLFGGAYVSQDGGQSWSRLAAGLQPESTVTDFSFHPINPELVFMTDHMSGVYVSQDGGASWIQITQGLTTRAVNELAFSSDGMHLYAATEGGGVFRLDLNGQSPEPAPQSEGGGVEQSSGADENLPPEPDTTEEGDQEEGLQIPCLGGSAPLFIAAGLVVVSLKRRKTCGDVQQ